MNEQGRVEIDIPINGRHTSKTDPSRISRSGITNH